MIAVREVESRLRKGRMEAKTLDNMFRRRVEQGANCAPFVSEAILREVRDVYDLHAESTGRDLGLGQLKFLATSCEEPAGKILEQCQKVTVLLTLDAGKEDQEIRWRQGVEGLRRARVLRMTTQAYEQGGLLSYEDLAYRLLNCGTRTIVRDAEAIRNEGVQLPTRGQQRDMGPRQNHRAKAVELYLQGYEYKEIARRLFHSLSSIENYVTTFARVVMLSAKGYGDDEIAFLIRRSSSLVGQYRKLYERRIDSPTAQRRVAEIIEKIEEKAAKKGGLA